MSAIFTTAVVYVGLPLLCLSALTLLAELGVSPRPKLPWHRPIASLLTVASSALLLFALLLLTQRPWLSSLIVLAFLFVLINSSNIKRKMLKEPFIYQDFEYFIDAIKHPRLYLPFYGIKATVMTLLGILLFLVAGFVIEPSLVDNIGWSGLFFTVVTGIGVSFATIVFTLPKLQHPTLSPQADIGQFGLIASFWAYYRALKKVSFEHLSRSYSQHRYQALTRALERSDKDRLPHIVAVQSESFFDPRLWCQSVSEGVLAEFDQLCSTALKSGKLNVPVWGANTIRTEAAFLTGANLDSLGVHFFQPYWLLAREPVASLPAALRQGGYTTVCIHPYPASFYQRDRVMPNLGFDHFIDIEAFSSGDKEGQYISDQALADKVAQLLSDMPCHHSEKPLFIFVITMESHGPLHLEAIAPNEANPWLTEPLPSSCRDLGVYLKHLKNADEMIASLQRTLQAQSRDGILCWYGDHVPIMEQVYEQLGDPEGNSQYAIWSTASVEASQIEPLDADMLGFTLAQHLINQLKATTLDDRQ